MTNDQIKSGGELEAALAKAAAWLANASPEEKEAMWKAQRESWSKGPHGPTDGMGTVYFSASRTPSHGSGEDRMREALRNIRAWVASLTVTDMNEIVADNGITAGMVVSQEAGEQLRRIDAALSAPQPIGIRRRAQRIVEIANQYEGYDEIALVRVPVCVLRAAAMIVNGQALAPMLNTMTAPETSGQVAQEEITPEDQAAAASIGMPNTAKVFSHHRRRAVEGLVEKVAKMEARPDWSGLTRVQLGYESGFAHAINAVTALLHAGHSDA